MNNKTVNSVRSALRHLALGTVVGSMMFVTVACGGSPEPSPTSTSTTTTTTTSTTTASPSDTGSPTSSTGTQGASETVTVTETGVESAPTGEASPKPPGGQPLVRPAVQQITRDPFVNPLTGGGMASVPTRPNPSSTTPKVTPATTPGTVSTPGKPGAQGAEEQEEVPPPDVTVTGIVQGSSGAMAIISGPEQSYIRRVGESLAEYKVVAISPKAVTFGYKGRKFKVKIQDEFGAGATGTKATPKRTK